MRRKLLIGLAAAAALAAPSAHADVRVEKVGDFIRPVYVTGAPGDEDRLYVVEQRGTIQVIEDGVARPFLDLRHVVRGPDDPGAGSEEGMTSIAFPPDFQATRRFYVYYTDFTGNHIRVDEFHALTGDTADPASQRLVIAIPHFEGSHHNGGQIQFGGGDLLYVAPGDGGTGGAPARDLGSLLGKLLRIDPRGDAPGEYSVPPGNPYAGQLGRRPEIWASGLRNPFRFSFDRATGDLTIGDVGEKTTEEINYLPAAGGRGRGADFGWNTCEGSFMRGGTAAACPLAGSALPAIERTRADGYKSIINGYVVRDPSLPSLFGRLVYGDFYVDRLRSVQLGPAGESDDREVGPLATVPRLTSFGEDAAGCVYATSFEGPVYRLVENDTRIPCFTAAAPAPATEDTRPPALSASVTAVQRLLRAGRAVAYVRCDEGCAVTIGGRLAIGTRRYAVRPVTRAALAGRRTRVVAPLSNRSRRVLRRALAQRRSARLTVSLRARDTMGNLAPLVTRSVRVRR
jgi:hypothetical protein